MRRVAYQGERGAFSEDAVLKFFGADKVIAASHASFTDVVAAVSEGRADFGVLPIENTIAGVITDAERAIKQSALKIVGEVSVPVEQCLLGVRGATVPDLARVMSHPRCSQTNPHIV